MARLISKTLTRLSSSSSSANSPALSLSSRLFSTTSSTAQSIEGGLEKLKNARHLHNNVGAGTKSDIVPQFLQNMGMRLGFTKVNENVFLPCPASFPRFIHSTNCKDNETGWNSRSMEFVRGIIQENGRDFKGGPQFPGYRDEQRAKIEKDANIVHIKLIRNNTFVTITDSKGNKKAGASSGCLAEMKGGPKASRYAAEATAEHIGRVARNMGLKHVVMKVNGFTFFKKKRQAILSFREGYTFSRGDLNPVVHIEDTTRRPQMDADSERNVVCED